MVVVTVRPDAIEELVAPPEERTARATQAQQAAARYGAELRPIHPDVSDPDLARFFVVEVAEDVPTDQVVDDLLACDAIESATAKPPDEPP
jgi:DNA repair photolyase